MSKLLPRRRAVAWSLSLLLLPLGARAADQPAYTPLFNGKNLDGWQAKIAGHPLGDNYGNTFRVEGGALRVAYDPTKYPRFDGRRGQLFYKQPFSHYRLRVEYRLPGQQGPGGPPADFRGSGILIHAQSPGSVARDQKQPVALVVQLVAGDDDPGRERPTGNVCTPGTTVSVNKRPFPLPCLASISKTFAPQQWVTVEVEVRPDGLINHFVNGELVLSYTNPELDEKDETARKLIAAQGGSKALTGGFIALSSDSHPVEFRKVEILDLDPAGKPK
jgi:hypothetical protein